MKDSSTPRRNIELNYEIQIAKQFMASSYKNSNGESMRNQFPNQEKQNFNQNTCRIKDLKEQWKINYSNNQDSQRKLAETFPLPQKISKEKSLSKKIYQQFLDDKRKELLQILYCSFGLLTMLVFIFHNYKQETKGLF